MNTADKRRAAALIGAARRRLAPLPGLPEECQPETLKDAYDIQELVVKGLARPVGWKVGATAAKVQELLGADEPFAGRLIEGCVHQSPAAIPAANVLTRKVEIEYAFRLAKDLPALGAPYDREGVAAAVDSLYPSLELPDTRYSEWVSRGALQIIADNGAGGHFVMGEAIADWRALDIVEREVSISFDGEEVTRGTGAQVMGDPLLSLAWLANDVASSGRDLVAGEIITTGSCADIVSPDVGVTVVGDFGDLGTVQVEYVA